MKPLCYFCGKKLAQRDSRFCSPRHAVECLINRFPGRAEGHFQNDADLAEELVLDGSKWCDSCRSYVFPDDSRHLSHPHDVVVYPEMFAAY